MHVSTSRYNYLRHLGRYLIMMKHAFGRPEKFIMYWKETMRQMNDIGVGSLIIVCLISVFIGAVAAVQFAYQLDGQLVPRYYIGYIVRDLALIELSPTITCVKAAAGTRCDWRQATTEPPGLVSCSPSTRMARDAEKL